MKILQFLAVGFALVSSSIFAADISSSTISSGNYVLAQNDLRPRDGVIDPAARRDANRSDADSKTRRNDSSSSSSNNAPVGKGLQLCQGEFAFCASSTCKPTGREIEVKEADGKTTKKYPEVACTCPIIDQKTAVEVNGVPLVGIAAVNEGNMRGSCTPPTAGTVWSYFSKEITNYPQESTPQPFTTRKAQPQKCAASSGTGSNCWNYLCKIDPKLTNGVRTATCLCPYGEGLFGAEARKSADFVTYAGGYAKNPSSACSQYPVGFPTQLLQ